MEFYTVNLPLECNICKSITNSHSNQYKKESLTQTHGGQEDCEIIQIKVNLVRLKVQLNVQKMKKFLANQCVWEYSNME